MKPNKAQREALESLLRGKHIRRRRNGGQFRTIRCLIYEGWAVVDADQGGLVLTKAGRQLAEELRHKAAN